MEKFVRNNANFKLICSEPRRIAALNLANRLSQELNVTLGKEVGYQIGNKTPVIIKVYSLCKIKAQIFYTLQMGFYCKK